jgi:hypothetical protein
MASIYIYQADVYCSLCTRGICDSLPLPEGYDPDNESSWNSDDYPKGPYPQEQDEHCAACGQSLPHDDG